MNAVHELHASQSRYPNPLDESDAIRFLAALRDGGVLTDEQWAKILRWLDDALRSLNRPKPEKFVLDFNSDSRNADWLAIPRAQRRAGRRMPMWASLWLWYLGSDDGNARFWHAVGKVAGEMGYPRFKVDESK